MPDKSVTLFVPGLRELSENLKHLPERDIPTLKNLQRFLSRAEKKSVAIHDWHRGLASLFQLEKLPAAELSYRQLVGTIEKNVFYLCADPVYIQPDLNSAVLLAHEELDLSLDDARELAAAINTHFADENWSLEVLTPHRWLMKLRQAPRLVSSPLARVMGKAVGKDLPQGENSLYWQRIQNEIQMLLFAHPLNEKREAQGKLPVNSLWLWGEGGLPEKSSVAWQAIAGKGALLEALASWCDCGWETISINDELAMNQSGQTLLASDEFVLAVQCHDLDVWRKALEQFENNWMVVLLKLLRAGELDAIDLFVGDGMQFTLNRKMLKRWWWPMKPFNHFFKL